MINKVSKHLNFVEKQPVCLRPNSPIRPLCDYLLTIEFPSQEMLAAAIVAKRNVNEAGEPKGDGWWCFPCPTSAKLYAVLPEHVDYVDKNYVEPKLVSREAAVFQTYSKESKRSK